MYNRNFHLVNMARGGRKLKNTQFKIGHECLKRRCRTEKSILIDRSTKYYRLSTDLYDKVNTPVAQQSTSKPIQPADSQGRVVLLRPRPSISDNLSHYLQDNPGNKPTYRILHAHKTIDFFNNCTSEHTTCSPKCAGQLEWDMEAEQKWGLCWRERLMCRNCNYRSKLTKLYDDVQKDGRGQKSAMPNLGAQVGLCQSSISTMQFRNILLAANIPAPSNTSMQTSANRVADVITTLNEEDMRVRREELHNITELRGLPRDTPIDAEGDGRYNNPLFGSADKTPFQPATQMVYTICENETSEKQVIVLHTVNKLCKKADMLQKQGTPVTCPNHTGCTANVSKDHTIGDEEYSAGKCAEVLSRDNNPLTIKHMTTDGDSKAYMGVKKVQESHNPGTTVENLRDPGHLSKTLLRTVEKCNFSPDMFPGRTREEKQTTKRRFSHNLKRRCSAEFTCAHKHWCGDINQIIKSLSFATDAMISCYGGICGSLCRRHSFVCSGRKKGCWDKSSYLPANSTQELEIVESDEILLRQCIDIRLGVSSVKKTKLATTTQKCESVNRSYQKTNPKSVTFSRNFVGRIHSSVHELNCGLLKSTIAKCAAVGAPITRGSSVIKSLTANDKRKKYHAARHKTIAYKVSRKMRRKERFELHASKTKSTTYKKGMLDATQLKKCDHAYSKAK